MTAKERRRGRRESGGERVNWKREIAVDAAIVAGAFLLVWLVDTFLLINAKIPSGSMENTIPSGARVVGIRLSYREEAPQRYDVVIFHYPDNEAELFVKRVIGLPGETVAIVDGRVYIDDSAEPLRDDFIAEPMEGTFGPYVVPEGSYFVLGDNRNHSLDSRYWVNKFVAEDKIIGKAAFVWFPFSAAGRID